MLYVMERLFESSYPVIIEGNFVPPGIKKIDEAGAIKQLVDKYNYESLTYKFMGDTEVLYKRFAMREDTPERGQANKMFSEVSYDDFNIWCHNLDKFDIGGKIIKVDTTDFEKLDTEKLIEDARLFIRR